MLKFLFILTIFFSFKAHADDGVEIIPDLNTEESTVILNNEIRKLDNRGQDLDERVDTLEARFSQDTASNDTYVISLEKAPTSYTTGMEILFKAVTANTGACTVNVNGLGAKSLKSLNDQDPADNYIEAGSIVYASYDGTNFQILSPDANP